MRDGLVCSTILTPEQAIAATLGTEMCHADGVSIKPPCPLNERDELCVYGLIQRDLREMGVEVP
jgi:hypothetical protein